MIQILIADDSAAIRDALSSLLNSRPDFEVIGLARDGLEAVERVDELLPDLVIMDHQMPNMDGIQATRLIKQAIPTVGVLVFGIFADCLEASIAAGADGCLMKDCQPETLYSELRRIAAISSAHKPRASRAA